jgi:hypothetical protein
MEERSSIPDSCPRDTAAAKIEQILAARVKHREGPVQLGERCQVPARTVSRIIARAGLPQLWELDPISGERIRASRATDHRVVGSRGGERGPSRLRRVRFAGGRIPRTSLNL